MRAFTNDVCTSIGGRGSEKKSKQKQKTFHIHPRKLFKPSFWICGWMVLSGTNVIVIFGYHDSKVLYVLLLHANHDILKIISRAKEGNILYAFFCIVFITMNSFRINKAQSAAHGATSISSISGTWRQLYQLNRPQSVVHGPPQSAVSPQSMGHDATSISSISGTWRHINRLYQLNQRRMARAPRHLNQLNQ